jgi:hypothetical protein
MFLISTRKRNPDKSFGHERMLKGEYAVYEISKSSDGKDAQQKTLEDIPVDKDMLLLIHGFNNGFDEVTAAYLISIREFGRLDLEATSWDSHGPATASGSSISVT